MKSKAVEERRFKSVVVADDLIWAIMGCALKQYPQALVMPVLDDLPEDAELIRVCHIPEEAIFSFLVAHESFDPVYVGGIVPRFVASAHNVTLILKQPVEAQPLMANNSQC